jgi:DNA-directed RNA polymerase specialized sigma24 family protein
MSVADLASAWNVPEETVRRLLRDGMLELREQFSAEGTRK